ncbi:hypothetical protein IscW_ISCW010566 [Ixodes scapularis]|uniref:Uncharacterized protein n=1 Tax=Ixodes scapularis TaxID=6945 RepID=B7Q7C3_IXOSC|nr:hypothetical protein IscW_ISCW010566 [Ixodes scapularis]|eukprot:XP_002403886.1 hypothetical protein IscW_ISCW010566 [Ixodes scapularis]
MTVIETRFRRSTRILRWAGAWFIEDATNPARQPLKTMLTRPYTWYCIFCFSILFCIELSLIFWTLLFSFGERKMFLNTLFVVLHITVVTKTLLSVVSLALSASKFKKLVNKARHFEVSRNFKPLPQHKKRITKASLRIWGQAILIVVFVVVRNTDMMLMVEISNIFLAIVLNVVMGAASVLLVIYDGMYSTVLKGLVEIYVAYLKKEVDILKKARTATGPQASSILEDCRLDVNSVQTLIRYTNRIMKYAIVIAYGGNLIMLCGIAYCLVDPTSKWSLRIFCFCYGVLISLDMVDIGFLVESLKMQASKMKWVLQSMNFLGLPDSFSKQVRFLHDCLESGQMDFSACGFFKVNLTLLISMGGAIITYTVILVQTSQGLSM